MSLLTLVHELKVDIILGSQEDNTLSSTIDLL